MPKSTISNFKINFNTTINNDLECLRTNGFHKRTYVTNRLPCYPAEAGDQSNFPATTRALTPDCCVKQACLR